MAVLHSESDPEEDMSDQRWPQWAASSSSGKIMLSVSELTDM